MKKQWGFVAAMISFLMIAEPLNAAGVKAGAKCTKVGVTSTVGSKKFTCIKSGKKLVWSKGVTNKAPVMLAIDSVSKPLEPSPVPTPISTPMAKPTPINTQKNLEKTISPEDISVCRIPDKSKTRRPIGPSIAYPVPTGQKYAMHPRTGPIRVIVIPIDFSDSEGQGKPSAIYAPEIERINSWMKWYSNGKSWFSWQTYDSWIRAPRPSYDYVANDSPQFARGNPYPDSKVGRDINQDHVVSELLSVAESHYDLTGVTSIWLIYPKEILHIYDSIVRNSNDQGDGRSGTSTFIPNVFDPRLLNKWTTGTGSWIYRSGKPIWAHFIHENLHNIGLQGHAPNQGFPLGIMTAQDGYSLPLSAWDQLILGWDETNDVYCVTKENLKTFQITLSPLEREQTGNKSVMIRLSDHEMLVIESRRRDKWSETDGKNPGLPEDLKGIVVYKIDTSKDPQYGIVEKDGDEWVDGSESFGYFIRNNSVSHGFLRAKFEYPAMPMDLNFFTYESEVLVTNGIKIKVLSSSAEGNCDLVEISRT